MNKFIITLSVLFTFNNWIIAQQSECASTVMFGDTKICLPKVEGYEECYYDPIVKKLADGTEAPVNVVLGYYLNNETYENRDSLSLIGFDDYFKFY